MKDELQERSQSDGWSVALLVVAMGCFGLQRPELYNRLRVLNGRGERAAFNWSLWVDHPSHCLPQEEENSEGSKETYTKAHRARGS